MTKIGVPKSFERFIVQANACMNHDSYDMLHKIKSPTLIIGGGQDRIVTAQAAPDMAKMIENASLFIYDELGHGLYEEATDFWDRVIDFLTKAAS